MKTTLAGCFLCGLGWFALEMIGGVVFFALFYFVFDQRFWPASLALLLVGVLGILFGLRRRRADRR